MFSVTILQNRKQPLSINTEEDSWLLKMQYIQPLRKINLHLHFEKEKLTRSSYPHSMHVFMDIDDTDIDTASSNVTSIYVSYLANSFLPVSDHWITTCHHNLFSSIFFFTFTLNCDKPTTHFILLRVKYICKQRNKCSYCNFQI